MLLLPTAHLTAGRHYSRRAMAVLQAIWVAEQLLDRGRSALIPTREATEIGLDTDDLHAINGKLTALRDVLRFYTLAAPL
jgi:hypothetical protein